MPAVIASEAKMDADSESPATESGLDGAEAAAMSNLKLDDDTESGVKQERVTFNDAEKEKMLAAMRQIESYLADTNLPYDKFLWTLHTANPEHRVPIQTLSAFKGMQKYRPLGLEWVTNALRLSQELEVNQGGTQVRRRTEVQEPKGQFERSIYAKGFGAEVDGLQKQLEEYFNEYGKTNAAQMRRARGSKEFKGSVFVEFVDNESVEAFLKADPKPSWNEQELLIMSKEAYGETKIKQKGLTGEAAINFRDILTEPVGEGFNAFKEIHGKTALNKILKNEQYDPTSLEDYSVP